MTLPKLPLPTTVMSSKSFMVRGMSWLRLYSTPTLTLPDELLSGTHSVPLRPLPDGGFFAFGRGSSKLGRILQLPRNWSSSPEPRGPGLRM